MILAICGWWYLGVLDWKKLLVTTGNDPSMPAYSYAAMARLVWGNLWTNQLRSFWWPLALAGLAVGLARKRSRLFTLAAAGSVAGAAAVLSLFVHTEERYLFPALPWAAMLAGQVIGLSRRRSVRAVVWALLAVVGAAGYLDTYYADLLFGRERGDKTLVDRCDQYQRGGRLPWHPQRRSATLARAVEDFARAHFSGEVGATIIVSIKKPDCEVQPHALTIGLAEPRRLHQVPFFGLGTPFWYQNARDYLEREVPVYFVVEEEVPGAFDEDAADPFIVDPLSGGNWPAVPNSVRLAIRNAVRERLPKVAEVELTSIGRVGVYYRAPGVGNPIPDLLPPAGGLR